MARLRSDTDGERKASARPPARPRKPVAAPWVEARPVHDVLDEERQRQREVDPASAAHSPLDASGRTDEPCAEGSNPEGLDPEPSPEPDVKDRPSATDRQTDHTRDPTTSAAGTSRRVWIWAAIAVVVLLGGAAWLYFFEGRGATRGGGQPQAQNDQQGAATGPQRTAGRVPVQVAAVGTQSLPVYLTGLGTVQAYNTVVVRSRVDGELQRIGFQEGQVVQAGDLIAQIDPRPYQASLDQAVAKKRQDDATLASNRLDLERTRQLARNSYASQQQLDQQTANVGSLTAQIAFDQAAIESAQTQFGYTTIRAPITGRTGLRLVDQGNIVHATDTTGIVEIAQIEPIAVIFTAPQRQLTDIAAAMKAGPVEVAALSSDGQSILDVGRLELINNAVDAASGTVRLKAAFPNVGDRLWPGLSVNTRLLQRRLDGALSVPAEAVQRGQNSLFAYVIGPDGKAEKRTIQVSIYTEGRAVVVDGLRADEKVVVAGQYRLTDGAAVDAKGESPRSQDAGQGGGTGDRSASAAGGK